MISYRYQEDIHLKKNVIFRNSSNMFFRYNTDSQMISPSTICLKKAIFGKLTDTLYKEDRWIIEDMPIFVEYDDVDELIDSHPEVFV